MVKFKTKETEYGIYMYMYLYNVHVYYFRTIELLLAVSLNVQKIGLRYKKVKTTQKSCMYMYIVYSKNIVLGMLVLIL